MIPYILHHPFKAYLIMSGISSTALFLFAMALVLADWWRVRKRKKNLPVTHKVVTEFVGSKTRG